MDNSEIVLDECTIGETGHSSALVYPCILIDGVTTEEEINFFRERPFNTNTSLPLFCIVSDTVISLGALELTLFNLLDLRSIYSYNVTLCKSAENRVVLDLNDPNTLIKFIKL